MKYLGDLNRIAGFTFKGTIYIDPRIATAETTLHEYTHLWAEVLRQRNPQEWQNIVGMMKDIPDLWQYVERRYAADWQRKLQAVPCPAFPALRRHAAPHGAQICW